MILSAHLRPGSANVRNLSIDYLRRRKPSTTVEMAANVEADAEEDSVEKTELQERIQIVMQTH